MSPANHPSALKWEDVPLPGLRPRLLSGETSALRPQDSRPLLSRRAPEPASGQPHVSAQADEALDAPCRPRTHPRSTSQLASVSGRLPQKSLIQVRDARGRGKEREGPSSPRANCFLVPGPNQGASQLPEGHRRVHDGRGQHSGQGLPRVQGEVSGSPASPPPSPSVGTRSPGTRQSWRGDLPRVGIPCLGS